MVNDSLFNPRLNLGIVNTPDVYLGKWPRLVVVGDPVTPEQAMEILIRTDCLDFSTNDRVFSSQCASYFYGKRIDSIYSFSDQFRGEDGTVNFHNYWSFKDKAKADVGQIELHYLQNSRIMSSWIGGSHGWCDWNGYIGCKNYNIGKYPEVEEVRKEWQAIATAFPYLNIKSKLITDEGEGNIAIEFEVKDGITITKTLDLPLEAVENYDIDEIVRNLHKDESERGCTYEKFVEAVDYTRTRTQQRIAPK